MSRVGSLAVGALALVSCAAETTVITAGSPDGVLDCGMGETPRAAAVVAEGDSEQQAVETALTNWLHDGASLANPTESEVWSAVVEGNEVAIAIPEREGDGGWAVRDVQTCGPPRTGPAATDGSLDCASEAMWTQQAMIDAETPGEETSENAIRLALAEYLDTRGGEIVIIDHNTGSLVVDEREQVIAFASIAPGGGWVAATLMGCDEVSA